MATGAQVNIMWGLEASFGTLATNVNKAFGTAQEMSNLEFDRQAAGQRGVGNRNIQGMGFGMAKVPFTLKFDLTQVWIFRLMTGGWATQGAGPWTYTFAESDTLPSFSVLNYIQNTDGGNNTLQTLTGCVVLDWNIDVANKNDPISITLNCQAAQVLEATTALSQVAEVDTLTITAAATVSSNVTVTLDNVPYTIAVLNGDSTTVVATKIAAGIYPGWNVSRSGAIVTFTAAYGARVAPAYAPGTTGATGGMVRTTSGVGGYFPTESPLTFANAVWNKNGTTLARTEGVSIKCSQSSTPKPYLGNIIAQRVSFGNRDYNVEATNYYSDPTVYMNDMYGGGSPTGFANVAPNANSYNLILTTAANQAPANETITIAIVGGYPVQIGRPEKDGEDVIESVKITGTALTVTVVTPEAVIAW